MGQHYANPGDEVADPESRDGMSAQLDEEQHQRAVQESATGAEDTDTENKTSGLDDA
jgi:hypothetical protein